jgi:predicted acylesterase/phospholipase RssA
MMGNKQLPLWTCQSALRRLETDALPNIVSGISAGSVVGAMLCTRTPEEIERDTQPEILQHKLK